MLYIYQHINISIGISNQSPSSISINLPPPEFPLSVNDALIQLPKM